MESNQDFKIRGKTENIKVKIQEKSVVQQLY